jgi:hypothetical protein
LGLVTGKEYKDTSTLRYKSILLMADQDKDGVVRFLVPREHNPMFCVRITHQGVNIELVFSSLAISSQNQGIPESLRNPNHKSEVKTGNKNILYDA